MSETETIPPPNEFVCDDSGLTLWRAELDGITVHKVFNGVTIDAFQGQNRVTFTLSADHARHLTKLLTEAVE